MATTYYRVRKSWADASSQLGAFSVLANAKALADKNEGYHVYDGDGIPIYPLPYLVQLAASTPYYKAADGKTKAGTASAGVYTITAIAPPYGKLKSGAGWVNLTSLDVYSASSTSSTTTTTTKSPLQLTAANVANVYNACIGCTHKSGSYTWAAAMSAKKVNCAIPASRVATLAGILPDGKLISHTTAVGSNILTSKNTIAKAISGYGSLDTSKCTIVRIAKKYADMDAAYKKAGVIFVQDSNIAVCAGDGDIYACHEWSKQMSNGKYTKVKLSSGYTKNSYILYAIVPND